MTSPNTKSDADRVAWALIELYKLALAAGYTSDLDAKLKPGVAMASATWEVIMCD